MSNFNDPNNGPGWGIANTPYGDVRNYNPSEYGSSKNTGNAGGASGTQPSSANRFSGYVTPTGVQSHATNISLAEMRDLLPTIRNHEGLSHTMYADTAGNVTVGVGIFLGNEQAAKNLAFEKRSVTHGHGDDNISYIPASGSQISGAFQGAKTIANDASLTYTQKANLWAGNSILISDDVISSTLGAHLAADRVALQGLYSGFNGFPKSAKIALHDMIYNLGESKLRNSFPSLNAAVNRQDWTTAATESHRTGIGATRNQDTFDQFMQAARGQ